MNLNLITYEDKEQLNTNENIPANKKCMASDLNEIKNALNTLLVPKLLNIFYPVGSYYETSDTSFNPNTSMGGTWELETDGTVLASKSNTTGSIFNADVGSVVGAETHTHVINGTALSIAQIPSHNHTGTTEWAGNHSHAYLTTQQSGISVGQNTNYPNITGNDRYTADAGSHQHTFSTSYVGSGQTHTHTANASSSVQTSKIVNRWHRTA